MKIAIVHPPDPIPSIASEVTQHPINLALLAAVLMQHGHECRIWDYGVSPYSDSDFSGRLQEFSPEVIGFSCVTPLIKTGAKMAALAKKTLPGILTIAGGPHVSAIGEQTLAEFPSFDVGVLGEGELTFVELVKAKEEGRSLVGLLGTVVRDGNKIVANELRPLIRNLDELPFANRDLIDFSLYRGSSSPGLSTKIHTITELFTSRGCPDWCIFCGSHVTHRGKVRFRSAQNVLEEVQLCIDQYGVDHFTIEDDTFTYGKKRLREICEGLSGMPVTWDCDSRVDSIDLEMLKVMSKAGCVKIAYGVESGSPRILKMIRKRISTEQIERAFRWTREVGIKSSGFLMIGSHPSETVEDLNETIRFVKKMRPDYLMVYCAVPFPGTELYEMMKSMDLISSEDWDEFDIVRTHPVWRTENFSPEELIRQQQRLYRSYYLTPRFVIKTLLELKNWDDVRYLLDSGARFLKYIFGQRTDRLD